MSSRKKIALIGAGMIGGMEFLLEKLKDTKTNAEFFEKMNS